MQRNVGGSLRVRFPRVKVSGSFLLAKLIACFFIVVLADIPVICAEERPGSETTPATATAEIRAVDLDTGYLTVAGTNPSDDCGCPCHHNFGGSIVFSPLHLTRLSESPARPAPNRITPPIQRPDHPPQNLL